MTRFYFHLYNDIVSKDEEGRELPDVDIARHDAREDARGMAAESVREGELNLDHYVEVADDTGETLFRVTFGEVVRVTGQ